MGMRQGRMLKNWMRHGCNKRKRLREIMCELQGGAKGDKRKDHAKKRWCNC